MSCNFHECAIYFCTNVIKDNILLLLCNTGAIRLVTIDDQLCHVCDEIWGYVSSTYRCSLTIEVLSNKLPHCYLCSTSEESM